MVFHREGEEHSLTYDLYSVDGPVMDDLDRLEGHPRWYVRTRIPTAKGMAWMYLMPEDAASHRPLQYLEEGDYLAHRSGY